MLHTCIFESSENKVKKYNSLDDVQFSKEDLKKLNSCVYNKKQPILTYLGIHQDKDNFFNNFFNKESVSNKDLNPEVLLKTDYFIGYRWFEKNETYVHVSPKLYNDKKADYMKMFMCCLKDPIISKKLDKTYKIFFDEPYIKIKKTKDEITPLIILHFLQLVKNITKKGLKKGYIKVTENLTSKIKGKILINQTIKYNHLQNRLDRTVCNHQIFTVNCLENRIIKTALMQCGGHLININNNKTIIKMLKQNISAFELVETKELFDNDFSKIKYSPFYKEYKEALNLSKMIFKRFGFSLKNNAKDLEETNIPPYYINMPELFERYVEIKLRENYSELIDGNNSGKIAHWQMKPDFLLSRQNMIIDAKYKYWYENGKKNKYGKSKGENVDFKDDYMQLSLYGRDLEVRKNIGIEKDEIDKEAMLLFVYPSFDTKYEKLDIDNLNEEKNENEPKFNKIKRVPLYIPPLEGK